MTHTPGPWEPDPEVSHDDLGALQKDGSRPLLRRYIRHKSRLGGRICVAFQNCLVQSDAELEANARLIAQSPRLLELLRRYIESDKRQGLTGTTLHMEALSAIAEVEGEKQ